jgi:hypothetical protein
MTKEELKELLKELLEVKIEVNSKCEFPSENKTLLVKVDLLFDNEVISTSKDYDYIE